MTWIDKLLDDYYRFLKQKTVITEVSATDWIEIDTRTCEYKSRAKAPA